MPQTLSDEWKKMLDETWTPDHELVHTLGNLTIVTQQWNSSLSNSPYAEKRDKLSRNGLIINQKFFGSAPEVWNSDAIKSRAQSLMQIIMEIWPALGAPSESTIRYRPKSLKLLGDTFHVKSWRDVAQSTVESVIQYVPDFQALVEKFPGYLQQEQFQLACRQLSNGYWLYLNLSGDAIRRFCESFLEEAGIPQDEFDLEMW